MIRWYFPALGTMKRYEIWRAKVRFEDSEEIKERPVLIWNKTAYIIAYKMTGTDRGDDTNEFPIRHWKESGLEKPTTIRIRKVLRLKEEDMLYQMGVLDKRDQLRFELRIAP